MKLINSLVLLMPILLYAQPCELGYELNGVDDYIKIPNTNYINTNNTAVGNRTIETWFKFDDGTNRQTLFEEGGGGNAIVLYVENNRVFSGAYRNNGSSACFFRSETLTNNAWYHIAFVIGTTGGTTTYSFYLNGILQDAQTAFEVPKHTGDNQLGRNAKLRYPNCATWTMSTVSGSNSEHCINTVSAASTTKYYFDGNIWGFRIWNSARTITEINNNINDELFTGANLVAYLDDDTVEYLDNSATWMTADANGNTATYTWLPLALSSNWNDVANWNGGMAPPANKLQKIIIPESSNYPSITSEVRIGKLELSDPSTEIIIEDGGTLNVYYDVLNSGTITVKNNGAFILQDNEAISGSGDFIVERDSPNYPDKYYFSIWSTPLIENDSSLGDTFINDVSIFEYDTSQNPSAYLWTPKSDNMQVGAGYFVRSKDVSGVITRSFTGQPNNGCFSKVVNYNGTYDYFNLIGNPYTSALDWVSFYEDNSDVIGGTMYFWSQSYVGFTNLASDYISYNATGSNVSGVTGEIGSASGVFVEALKTGTVTFKNTHRVIANNSQFFRGTNAKMDNNLGKSWFRLSGDNGFLSILLGFIPNATDGYDLAYDGKFIGEGSAIEFYSLLDEVKYAIQGRAELIEDTQVPLGFQVTQPGTYTFSIDEEYIDSSYQIYLEDKLENIFIDLRENTYDFTVINAAEDNDRFVLHFSPQTLSTKHKNLKEDSKFITYFEGEYLKTKILNDPKSPQKIELYDILSKSLLQADYNETILLPKRINSGIYIVKYTFSDSEIITKKVLKEL